VKNYIKYQLGKDSIVIYPPAPVHLYDTEGDFKKNIVVSVGRVDPEKRFDLIGVVGPRIPEAKFILIGTADAAGKKIVEQIEAKFKRAGLGENFAYLGRVPEYVKRELLLKAKALFHPAPYESFSVTIVEGMAAGAIPIAHNSGGTPEVVSPNWLFTSVGEAVEKVRNSLSEDLSARKKIKEIALKFNEERFKNEMLHVVERLIIEDRPRINDKTP
jgi:glycosyltransferase involved in cell wall biosynthesis